MLNLQRKPAPYGFRVLPTAEAVVDARRHVVAVVRRSPIEIREGALDDLALLADEVIANAITYSRASCAVCVRWTQNRVRIEVTDSATELPHRRQAGSEDESGRGLQLVEALAADWDVIPSPTGKVVWFEIETGSEHKVDPVGASDAPAGQPLRDRGIRTGAVAQTCQTATASARS